MAEKSLRISTALVRMGQPTYHTDGKLIPVTPPVGAQEVSAITYPHIETSAKGIAIISGTTTKIVENVQDQLAHHWHAEDICRQYPYLSLAQVHAALAYYYDPQQEMEQEMDRRRQRVTDIKMKRADDTIQDKLRRLGHLP